MAAPKPKPRRRPAARPLAELSGAKLVTTLRALLLAAAERRLRGDFEAQLAAAQQRSERSHARQLTRLERQQRELGARLTRLQQRVTTLGRRTDRALRELLEFTGGERIDDRVLAIADTERLRDEVRAGLADVERRLLAAIGELQRGNTDRQQLAHLLTDVARQVKLPRDRSA